ncbi:MAG TPA: extracellular solute-binding protein [Actinomycetota bacterium]
MLARRTRLIAPLVAVALLAACEGDAGAPSSEDGSIVVYSGRDEEFVKTLFDDFTADTGIEVEVRYGDSAELAATLLEEGDASPADVFFAQDAGSLGAVAAGGLLAEINPAVIDRVDERFHADEGTWVGTSGRGRVAVYNSDLVDPSALPGSILGFTDPAWRGLIGLPPTNSSFQAHVAAMIETIGEDETRDFLEGLMANEPVFYEDNGATTRGVAAGEVQVGLVNHYYKFEVEAEDGSLPIENHYFDAGDVGAFINAAGVGVLASSGRADDAAAFVDYLTGDPGQTFVAEESWEYPVVDGYDPSVDVIALSEFQGPDVNLSELGATMPQALELLAEVGMI